MHYLHIKVYSVLFTSTIAFVAIFDYTFKILHSYLSQKTNARVKQSQ